MTERSFLAAFVLALGMAIGGGLVGWGFARGRSTDQFARDSGSRLGGIRQANQGLFVILPRDQAPGVNESGQLQKTVRVVSTVQYFLE